MNLRHAIRLLYQSPGFTAVSVLTLALGIGASTVVFTLYEAVALKPIAAHAPQELVRLAGTQDSKTVDLFSYAQFQELSRARSVTGLIASSGAQSLPARLPEPLIVRARFVSSNYFQDLGVSTSLGRPIQPGDHAVAVVSYNFWRQKLHGDRAALTRRVRLQNTSLDVIGVAPENFAGTGMPPQMPDLWIPLEAQSEAMPGRDWTHDSTAFELQLLGRLGHGANLGQASAELDAFAASWPPVNGKPFRLTAKPATFFQTDSGEFSSFTQICGVLMAAVALVLIIGSVNLVNLLFARMADREREIAVRAAVGASTGRLVRQLCGENALLGLVGGAVGLLLSLWACDWIRVAINGALERATGGALGVHLDIDPDWRVFVYATLVSLAAGFAVALWPALRASRRDLTTALKEGSGASAAGYRSVWSARSLLISAQVTACLVLLAGAGLLFRGVWRSGHTDPGFETQHLMMAVINTKSVSSSAAAQLETLRTAIGRIRELPEIASVALTDHPPFLSHWSGGITTARGTDVAALANAVSAEYFDATGIGLVAGRTFTRAEIDQSAPVVLVDEAVAAKAWPGQNPLGQIVKGLDWLKFTYPHETAVVIGVVKNVHSTYLSKADQGFVYVPKPLSGTSATLMIRTRPMPETAFHSIVTALAKVNAGLPSQTYLLTVEQAPLAFQRLMAQTPALVAAILGFLALLLASVGIFGLVSQLVAQRTREIAIRVALGAQNRDVARLVLGQTMRPVIVGAGLGLIGAAGLSALLVKMVNAPDLPDLTYGAGSFHPLSFFGAVVAMAVMIGLASLIPVRRAMRVEPAEALRSQ